MRLLHDRTFGRRSEKSKRAERIIREFSRTAAGPRQLSRERSLGFINGDDGDGDRDGAKIMQEEHNPKKKSGSVGRIEKYQAKMTI
jgi:hypothetical protein